MSMESQEAIFGTENSAPSGQSSGSLQLQDQDAKIDDSIDNQQQARSDIRHYFGGKPVLCVGSSLKVMSRSLINKWVVEMPFPSVFFFAGHGY